MVRKLSFLALAALTGIVLVAGAGEMTKAKPTTITGEIVDTGCYLGHGARGAEHVSCATKCIANGMPMGILTSQGTLYLLTMDHSNADPYNKLKDMAGKTVAVTGVVSERSGMKGVDVTDFKLVAAAKAN